MRCPRCNAENDRSRTICSSCGYYMYKAVTSSKQMMSPEERAKEDRRLMWSKIKKVLTILWRGLVIVVMTFWIIALILWLASPLF